MKKDISNWINLASAIGTIGATTVALWLALRDTGRHVDGTFIWEAASSYQPILLIQNTSGKIVVLESIEIKYYGKIAYMIDATEDFKFARQSIIEAGNIQKIPINTGKLKFAKPSNPKRKYALKVIIRQRTGPKKVCTVKYSYEELDARFFGQGLFSGG